MSLATDSASEAIYPLLPFFLTQVLGAGAVSLGVVEGAAEAANSVLKIVSGRAADRAASKRPLVLAGYSLSSLVRPLISIAHTWTHVFAVRLFDRVGKGIRGAPRDAMLAMYATPQTRGRIYGFHRAMDHTGAVLGPLLASVFLYFYPGSYRTLFALTLIPGAIAVALIFFVSEAGSESRVISKARGNLPGPASPKPPPVVSRSSGTDESDASDLHDLARSGETRATMSPLPSSLTQFFVVLTIFTLGNSTDAFLLLKLTDVAGSAQWIPLMWAALHVVKAGVSLVAGSWSDTIGRRAVILNGWLIYAAVYVGFAMTDSLVPLLACFMVYGFYFGFAEGTEKALIADLAPESHRGFAFGIYNAVQGIGALAASLVFGWLWTVFGPAVAFGAGAALALLASVLLFIVVPARSATAAAA